MYSKRAYFLYLLACILFFQQCIDAHLAVVACLKCYRQIVYIITICVRALATYLTQSAHHVAFVHLLASARVVSSSR